MRNFLNHERIEPDKIDAVTRAKDYKEIYGLYEKTDARNQASRCVQCANPYCHTACPLGNHIPYWLKFTTSKDIDSAFKISNDTSPFPEITGRICPQDRLCEGDCTLNDGHGAITIGSIETYISETGFKKGLSPTFAEKKLNYRVAVIGSGPAGISVATFLLREGINVTMYERSDRAGGLMTYGIPEFKLAKSVVDRRVNWLKDAGMELVLDTEIGVDVSFDDVSKNCDALFIGIGATKSNKINIPNSNANNIVMSIDFLNEIQKRLFGQKKDKRFDVKDKNVVVIGGGDTAMDCVRTSIREGAKSVKCLYRRDQDSMPGSKKEFQNAKEEGVEFVFNLSPKEFIVDKDNNTTGIIMQKTKLTHDTKENKTKLEIVKNSESDISADIVILALGFSAQNPDFLNANGIETNKWGDIIVDKNFETSQKGIYAGGDCYRGADLVVNAAYDGREAAYSIIQNLTK
jgi:glutamate synthase (NADPH/NADH) small chain